MEKKDYFSAHAKVYAEFRPTYPSELYQFIFKNLRHQTCAWDCATGNGQVALFLASHFETVFATDMSQQQIDQGFPSKNIFYSVCSAEHTTFRENQFDLITVGQALHWFSLEEFYKEVRRTAQANGLLAVWGYAFLTIDPLIDERFLNFYKNTVGPYWDPARKLVENKYRDMPFPFEEIVCPEFNIKVNWTLAQLAGYLTSWSATQKYIRVHKVNPVDAFVKSLKNIWKGHSLKLVTFPLFMKLGRVRILGG